MTPPTASKLLKEFEKEDLLKSKLDKGYLLFRANRENKILKDFSRIYWKIKLEKLVEKINEIYQVPTIILFGSLSKLEAKEDSDIDLAIISKISKDSNIEKLEKVYSRKIQLFNFKSFDKINKELKNNIINGYILQGELS